MKTYCKLLILLISLMGFPTFMRSQTETVTVNGLKYYLNTNGTATLSGRSSDTLKEINIPAKITYNGVDYPVTTIGNNAFNGGEIDVFFNNITKVTFETPSNVTYIGKEAFATTNMNGSTLTIPGSVKEIGEGAFYFCNMGAIVFEDGVEKIGKGAFYDCRISLTSITFPASLKSIAPFAFMWCTKVSKITLPEGLKSIGSFAFAFNYALKELHMPSTLEYFGNSVLFNNYQLSDITIQPNCQYFTMGEGNEEGIIFNKDKTRLIFFSAEQKLLGRRHQYKVPTHVKEIGGGAFSGVRSELKSIVLPSTLELIDSFAFIMNPLERITIPAKTRLNVGSIPSECKEIYMMGSQGTTAIKTALSPVILYPCSGLTSRYYGGDITAALYTKESLLPYYTNLAGITIGGSEASSKITVVSSEIPAKTAKKLTSMCRDFDVDMTNTSLANGVKAYIATEAKKGTVTEIDGNTFTGVYMTMKPIDYIPSRTGDDNNNYTGVILLGEPDTDFKFKMGENDCFSDAQTTLTENNLLEGAPCYMHVLPSEEENGTTYQCYGLNNGRFKYYSAEGTLAYNKAYLRIPIGYSYGAKEIIFSFDDAQSTGIHSLEDKPFSERPSTDDIYDLQGRRYSDINGLQPGIYIIDGKKNILK